MHFVDKLQKQYAGTNKAFKNNIVEIFYWYNEEEMSFLDIKNFYTSVGLDLLQYRIAIRVPEYITEQLFNSSENYRKEWNCQ